jgi:hypothetical protein
MTTVAFKMNMKPKTLTEDQMEFLEIHFYQVWSEGPDMDLYEFVGQEAAAFVRANPSFPVDIVRREFLRLARMEG